MNNSTRPLLARMGLVAQTTRWRPTLRAWLALAILAAGAGLAGVRWIHPFLAVNDRIDTRVLVVEGWLPDFTPIGPVIREFRGGRYDMVVVTGGPTPKRELLGEYRTYAELTKAILEKKGLAPGIVFAVPSLGVTRDRTYASAVALKDWMDARQPPIRSFNLLTLGAHARRSRLLFEKAMGGDVKVGVISAGDLRYDANNWWKSSGGVREVLGETIAYLYARVVFDP